jgi:hypothetical protein
MGEDTQNFQPKSSSNQQALDKQSCLPALCDKPGK